VVETISDARDHLTGHVARFRREGLEAEPVILGNRREPEVALIPYETFQLLLDIAEDLAIAERIRERESRPIRAGPSYGQTAFVAGRHAARASRDRLEISAREYSPSVHRVIRCSPVLQAIEVSSTLGLASTILSIQPC
jgi:PHD/YefM family antitoxin component YafN of YafNO toxin-antitoxin module